MTGLNLGRMALPARERRESDSYTSSIVSAQVAAARGKAGTALATIEACAGLYERAFMTAVSPVLKPWQLALIGRGLLLCGESVWFVPPRRGGGRTMFEPVVSLDVQGRSADPSTWRYDVTVPSPSTTCTVKAGADRVLHVRSGCVAARPWRGIGPFQAADSTRVILANVERQLSEESSGPVGHVLPVPAPTTELADDANALQGRVLLGRVRESGPGRIAAAVSRMGSEPDRHGPSGIGPDRQERRRALAVGGCRCPGRAGEHCPRHGRPGGVAPVPARHDSPARDARLGRASTARVRWRSGVQRASRVRRAGPGSRVSLPRRRRDERCRCPPNRWALSPASVPTAAGCATSAGVAGAGPTAQSGAVRAGRKLPRMCGGARRRGRLPADARSAGRYRNG